MFQVLGMQLMRRLNNISISNYLHLYMILLVFLILSIKYPIFILVLIYLIYRYKKVTFIFLTVSIFILFSLSLIYQTVSDDTISEKVLIIEKHEQTYQNSYIVLSHLKRYEFESKQDFNVYDLVEIRGNLVEFNDVTIPNGFDEKNYQLGNGVIKSIEVESVVLNKRIDALSFLSSDSLWIKLFKDENFFEVDNIGFLFSLSSMNLMVLYYILHKILYYLDIKDDKKHLITAILAIFGYLIGFSYLVLRILLKSLFSYINLTFDLHLTKLDIESLV